MNRYLGLTDYEREGEFVNRCYVKWDLKNHSEFNLPVFSAQAEIWNKLRSNVVICGQCVDEVAKIFTNDSFARDICRVWEHWHLNDLRAGTPEQMDFVKQQVSLHVAAGKKIENWYKFAYEELKKAGLYEVPLNGILGSNLKEEVKSGKRGYRFGESWLFERIPQPVADKINSWVG